MSQNGIDGPLNFEEKALGAFNQTCHQLFSLLLNLPGLRVPGNAPRPGEVSAGTRGCDVFTSFGHVRVDNRAYFYNPNTKTGRFPFDDALGLINGCTPALAKRALECAATHPYDKAAQIIRKNITPEMTPDILKTLVRHAGNHAAGFFTHPLGASVRPDAQQAECVVLTADGTGMPMRRKHLRGVKGRGPDGKAKTREAKLSAIYKVNPVPGQPAKRLPNSTSYTVTLERKAPFADRFRCDYRRRFPVVPKVTLFLCDGSKWLREIRRTHFPHAIEILDFYHAAEHLAPLLDLAGLSGKDRKTTFKKWRCWLKAGKVGRLIEVCQGLAATASGDDAKAWKKALVYYENNRGRMKYDEYLANGWPIGSGVVEAGCKTVVGARFKQPGMRWSRKGTDALFPFRTALLSGRYDELWTHILHKRNPRNAA